METRLLEAADADRYRSYVRGTSHSTFYHTYEWLTLLRETYGYQPHYLLAEYGGEIRGVLPLFLVRSWFKGRNLIGLPFSHAVGLVYEDVAAGRALIQAADRLGDQLGIGYIEIKSPLEPVLVDGLDVQTRQLNYVSKLTLDGDIEQMWMKLDRESSRWGVRKARRSGVRVQQGKTLADFKIFYDLEAETRRRQGVPLYPFSLFHHLHDLLLPQGQCRLYLAYVEEIPVGGTVVLYHKDQAIYGYSATKDDREYLRLRPTDLLLWTAIEDAHAMGCRVFNLGSTPLSNEGLLNFKKRWGTETSLLTYSYLLKRRQRPQIIDREGWKIHLARWMLQRSPLSVTKAVGPLLVKHLG